MYAYAIPALSSVVAAYQLLPSTLAMQNNSVELAERLKKIRSFCLEQLIPKPHWNVNSLTHVTALALGISAPLVLDNDTWPLWAENLKSARTLFDTTLGKNSIPEKPTWITKAWLVALAAQAVLCYKSPLSTLTRVASLTATIALPYFSFIFYRFAENTFEENLKQLNRYAFSNLVITNFQLNTFIYKNTPYKVAKGWAFNDNEINDLGSWLTTGIQPQTLRSWIAPA